jgi:beta-glucosidase
MLTKGFKYFPNSFIWGASTSAYQIEGSWDQEGKGVSIWDTFSHQPGKIYKGHHGDVAADHYQRWMEDVDRMAELGLKAYRFSTSWPRILPLGSGRVNTPGLDFYDRLVDALLSRDIQPFLTLYHWDLPQALQDLGGWPVRDTAYRFAEYAGIVAKRLGDRVPYWITHNEPLVTAMSGHLLGEHPPGIQDPLLALNVVHNLLLSHGLAVEAIRATVPQSAQVGITLNLSPFYPAEDSEDDRLAAQRGDTFLNRLFLDPLFRGRYPDELLAFFGSTTLTYIQDGDFQEISLPLDFLGVNYYSRIVVRHDPHIFFGQASQVQPPGSEYSQMWEIYPTGLSELLIRIWEQYRPEKIFITENGIPIPDGIDFDGKVRDYRRINYLNDHILQAYAAVEAGVPLQGYFVWSFLDNFEWAYGYQMRFGLVHVDFETLARTTKESGYWYAKVIRENGLDPAGRPGC